MFREINPLNAEKLTSAIMDILSETPEGRMPISNLVKVLRGKGWRGLDTNHNMAYALEKLGFTVAHKQYEIDHGHCVRKTLCTMVSVD